MFVLLCSGIYLCLCVCDQLNEELKQNLRETMTQKYKQNTHDHVTNAVDKLQQEVSLYIPAWMHTTTSFTG